MNTGDLRVRAQVLDNVARICPVIDKGKLEICPVDTVEWQNVLMRQSLPYDYLLP